MTYYNLQRTHQRYRLKGKTPAQALREAIGIEELPSLEFVTGNEQTDDGEPTIQTEPNRQVEFTQEAP